MNIEISEEINQRLSTHRIGFETQEQVIERLLDHYETKENLERPVIEFVPNESDFKRSLILKKSAWKELHLNDGTVKIEEWVASQFRETSSLRSNIWSGPLRDWKSKDIKKLILSTEKTKTCATNQGTVEIQVGKFVKAHIYNIIELCKTNDQYKKRLVSKEWCHANLCIQFPFLLSTKWVREENLHERYWTAEYKIAMWSYRVCSQFGGSTLVGGKTLSEQHGKMFLRHLKENDLLLPEFQNKQIKFIVKGA
ncbi:hypothetical protein AB4179_16910 [Vibrio lentus]|uniref:hypothetical protein n=1 Tax=Vibrio lentus TaxID=136468 RepID=UPI00247A785F|nr:hypothetical protein [Vibrio lentus]WGS60842.1 hypothetical protein ISX51_00765 [Vibrio lentus]